MIPKDPAEGLACLQKRTSAFNGVDHGPREHADQPVEIAFWSMLSLSCSVQSTWHDVVFFVCTATNKVARIPVLHATVNMGALQIFGECACHSSFTGEGVPQCCCTPGVHARRTQ